MEVDAAIRYFEQEVGFVEAVERGELSLQEGEYVNHEELGQRLQRFLRPDSGPPRLSVSSAAARRNRGSSARSRLKPYTERVPDGEFRSATGRNVHP